VRGQASQAIREDSRNFLDDHRGWVRRKNVLISLRRRASICTRYWGLGPLVCPSISRALSCRLAIHVKRQIVFHVIVARIIMSDCGSLASWVERLVHALPDDRRCGNSRRRALNAYRRRTCRLVGVRQQANVTHGMAVACPAPPLDCLPTLTTSPALRPRPCRRSVLGILVRQNPRSGFPDHGLVAARMSRCSCVFRIWVDIPSSSWRPSTLFMIQGRWPGPRRFRFTGDEVVGNCGKRWRSDLFDYHGIIPSQ